MIWCRWPSLSLEHLREGTHFLLHRWGEYPGSLRKDSIQSIEMGLDSLRNHGKQVPKSVWADWCQDVGWGDSWGLQKRLSSWRSWDKRGAIDQRWEGVDRIKQPWMVQFLRTNYHYPTIKLRICLYQANRRVSYLVLSQGKQRKWVEDELRFLPALDWERVRGVLLS